MFILNKQSLVLSLLICFSFLSCKDEILPEEEVEMPTNSQVATLDITVTQCIDASCTERNPLPGVDITLYSNVEDRSNFINEIRKGQSNVEGKLVVNNLQVSCVFIRALDNELEVLEKENTPVNSISFLEIIFPFE